MKKALITCKCGWGGIPNYGNWIKGYWNKGKKHTDQINLKKGLSGKLNSFYGKKHSEEAKRKIGENNKGRKFSKEINLKKGKFGKNNSSYKTGYYMIYKQHNKLYRSIFCESCKSIHKLEIHHSPSMNKENCLFWKGKVYTLCRKCHMDAHRGNNGKFKKIGGII